ncbi:MAG: ATP-dependent helicase [Austwickia sp.]|nr:ATP-dependent helicase [Austwickia sp.]MBK8435032.1 ATP-dependent helicase [Austwickia sp.]MBK9101413.1 ATP-dependent helicase [Austwickia sp.]
MNDILDRFSAPTREWFRASFPSPTPAQVGAWEAISSGQHALVVAPTGSGKTLSAFLWALDRLIAPAASPVSRATDAATVGDGATVAASNARCCRILYISPLKALATDVERNLRAPLVGIGHAANRLGLLTPDVRVATRTGDTSAKDRRAFATTSADVLITTPESLFLLLTSQARQSLTGVETVIIDEVHAVAGTKRGAHLAVTLERLDALLATPAQRIGLSATVRPLDEVGRYLSGGRPVQIVAPASEKRWDLQVVVPVPDLAELGQPTGELTGAAAGAPERTSIWPHVEERIVDLILEHRSTLVFANSRRLAERLTSRLNELWADRCAPPEDQADNPPGDLPGDPVIPGRSPAGPGRTPSLIGSTQQTGGGAPAELARAHHGSVSREQRARIEDDLKSGRLPAVVATSSLELGIDMGAVDLVVQVEAPPSVASGLQRVGRAGHHVGAVSHGVLFPKYRGDLVATAVVAERMRSGGIESLQVPTNPLDVVAQQIVAMCAMDTWSVAELLALMRRSAPYATLSRAMLESVLDMLSGRYPSEEFAELRPRIVWDRVGDTLTGRPFAQRLAVTSGGTIPDRGLFGVFLVGSADQQRPGGRRVGELDEEMVYESRVGDVFTLGTSSWRIEDITHDQVLVTPAPGVAGRLPFWKGEAIGRPAELGAAIGAFQREVSQHRDAKARDRVMAAGLDTWATDNVVAYLGEQREATGVVPSDRTLVVERFRDEIGDWRIVIHSPYGSRVHAPWALCLGARLRTRFGVDIQAMHADDGIVLRLPDVELSDDQLRDDLGELVCLDPADVETLVTEQIGGSALFASRFRECAARALLLPRRRPDRRQALWQQRQRSAHLLEVASRYPSFPIVLEAVRECVQDVFDVPALVALMRALASREVSIVAVDTSSPSPFARSLLFGYVAQYLYEGDSPLAERRAAALALDPSLLSELLGRTDGTTLADLLDPQALARMEAELQALAPDRQCRHAEDAADLLRRLGPLTTAEIQARAQDADAVAAWLTDLDTARRVIEVRIAGEPRWAAVEDAGRLRDALGAALPVGVPAPYSDPVTDPLGDLAARYARTHGPFTARQFADRFGMGTAPATAALRALVASGRLVEGALRPLGSVAADAATDPPPVGAGPLGGPPLDFCDVDVLRLLRRRSLAALRAEVEPVSPADLARFLPAWQGCSGSLRGPDGLLRAVEQLAGAVVPASAVETLILPARVPNYSPAMLDELMGTGELLWRGHGALAGDDGWISLHLGDAAAWTLAPPAAEPSERADLCAAHHEILNALAGGGAYFFRRLSDTCGSLDDAAFSQLLWDLVWSGRISNDSLTPVRARLRGRGAHRAPARPPRSTRLTRRGWPPRGTGVRPALPAREGPPGTAGRWFALPEPEADLTTRTLVAADVLLDRYGVVTRGSVVAEDTPGGFAAVYRVLAAAEEAGRVRRGYFVEGLGAAQFATAGAIDRLRAQSRSPLLEGAGTGARESLVLAATDPANAYGAALPWPERAVEDDTPVGGVDPPRGHRPGRKAGAVVVLVDGLLVLYVERGGATVLSWSEDPDIVGCAAAGLADAVRGGALGAMTVRKTDGAGVLGSQRPLVAALANAGFHLTPRGLRIRK